MSETIKKYWMLFALELLLLLLVLPGCFQKESRVFSCKEIVLDAGIENGLYKGTPFELEPGVYQVRAYGVESKEGMVLIKASSEDASFRGLQCNGGVVFEQQEYVDFEIYVLDSLEEVILICEQMGGQSYIENIEVYRMNWGSRILAFWILVGSLLVNMLILFREGILSGRIEKEKQVVFWGLLGSILIAYYPYLTDYFSYAADIVFHWLRIEGLKETLMQTNQFPIRVQSYWLYDHGYAVSAFYGDLFLVIPAFLRFIGFTIMDAYKMFVFIVMTATAWITYYSFKQCTKHTYAALFGAIIYMLAPYRIYNFYHRGAVGEFLGMTFLPLVICGMYRLFTEDISDKNYRLAKWPLIIGMSCILQSHMLSTEMTVLFLLVICMVFWRRTFRKETFVQLLQAAVLCLLINMWFWLPLLQMMLGDTYRLSTILNKGIQCMGTWFGEVFRLYPSRFGLFIEEYGAEVFQMGIASLLMLIGVLGILFRRKILNKDVQYKNPYDRSMLFWSGMVVFSWFLSTRYFPWDFLSKVPVVQMLATSLQFPTRLFAMVSVFAAIYASFFYLWFETECDKRVTGKADSALWKKGGYSILIILAVFSAVYHVNDIAYMESPVWLYNAENMGTISLVHGEYLLEGTVADDYYFHGPEASGNLKYSDYEKNGTSIRVHVDNASQEENYLELPLIGYIGYGVTCENTGGDLPYITQKRGKHGDLRIAVPAGYKGNMEVSYKGLASFRVAEIISLLTLLGIAVHHIRRRVPWNRKAE